MRLEDIEGFWGKRVSVTCVGGDVVTGVLESMETDAEHDEDEPDAIDVSVGKKLIYIPVPDISSVEEAL